MSTTVAAPEVRISRVIDAPQARVFEAWASANSLVRWHAPHGCTIKFFRFDFRAGGGFHSCIHTAEGYHCMCRAVYHEIMVPKRIVYSMTFADAEGNYLDPSAVGADPDWPGETTVTVTFEDVGGKTKLSLHQTVSEALAMRTGAHPSWLSMLDRLEGEVAMATVGAGA